MEERKTILEVNNLNVDFETDQGTVYAVRDVSFHVKEGEILGIVGESGSGKTASMFTVMGLLAANGHIRGGDIIFDGENIARHCFADDKTYEKKMRLIRGNTIGMVFQDPTAFLNPVLPVGVQLREVILNHNPGIGKSESNRRTVELLHRVGIPSPEHRMHQYPFEFSGGMRHSIMVAIALANRPKLIIADEPTSALDATTQARVLALIRETSRQTRASVIMITHNPGIVARFCDRISIMYGGRIVETGDTREIFSMPNHPYTEGLLNCLNIPDGDDRELTPIPGSPPDMLRSPEGCPFVDRCDRAMRICKTKMPQATELSDTHSSFCWLNEKKRREEARRYG